MSVYVQREIWDIQEFTPAEKFVLMALAHHAKDDGSSIFPSVATLAWETGLGPRFIKACLKRFRERGILIVVRESGPARPTHYRLDIAMLQSLQSLRDRLGADVGESHDIGEPDDRVGESGCGVGESGCGVGAPGTPKPSSNNQREESGNDHLDPPTPLFALAHESEKDLIAKAIEIFHEECPSLPRVMAMSKPRQSNLRQRLKILHGDIERWRALCRRVEASDFLTGRKGGDRPFRASFDWLITERNFIKVVEGNYDNRRDTRSWEEKYAGVV